MKWSGVGNEKQKEYIEKLIADGRLSHAYLLAGPEEIGKRAFAEDIVHALVAPGYELDVMRLVPERDEETGKIHDIPIEETTKLKSWISLRPYGAHKVVVIDHADRLGGQAANNLLKVLEEPPAYAHFFLITSQPGQVLATIASRCERMDFLNASEKAGKVSEDVTALGAALKAGIAEKIVYAKKLADAPDALETIKRTLTYVHGQLAVRPELAPVAHGLLDLVTVLAEPQYNRRLAIEHFLLSTSVQK